MTKGILVQRIPPNLYNNLISEGLSLFDKIKPAVCQTAWKW